MGSCTHIVDDKEILNQYEYDAWGNVTSQKATVKNRFKFNGQQLDPITHQYYLRARFYNPIVARFTQEDTYRGDGLNLYSYCANNPVYYVDPSGNSSCMGGKKAIETASGFKYKNNPSDNPKVLEDAIEDPTAIYGYRPKEGGSLHNFANRDWSDPILVEEWKQTRLSYHKKVEEFKQISERMIKQGATEEEIARLATEYRNKIRLDSYLDKNGNIKDPKGYEQALEHSVTYEQLIQSGKTNKDIINSATRGNPAMDACLGLYDEYYHTYIIKK